MSEYILGLDLGPNSIGWAMLEIDPESGEPMGFLDTESAGHPPMGVRVFEAGLDNFDTAKEQSRNQSRRSARSMRRNHARRNARRRKLREFLQATGLLPADKEQLDDLMHINPYELRAKGLKEKLEPHEIGRALYHICQRRGFKSNRKSGQAKEDEGILKEIGELEKDIKAKGAATLGEYLYRISQEAPDPCRFLIRKRHTRRDMYEQEFDALMSHQRGYHPNLLSDQVIERAHHYIFFQHPFELTEERLLKAPPRANLHRAPSVRPCPLEPDEMCCPKGEWEAQQFRIYKEVANLRVSENYGQERKLTPEEREVILNQLQVKDKVTFDQMRKQLAKIGVDPEAMFNLERGGRKALLGNSVEHKLATAFKRKNWAALPDATKRELRDMIVHCEDPEAFGQTLEESGLATEQVAKILRWTPADGYLGYSLKAIKKLLPHLEQGLDEYDAIEAAYPDRPVAGVVDFLPSLVSDDLPPEFDNLTNPVVRRALVEVRKVINSIIREHGKPARIVLEMARELKMGPQSRKDYNRMIREREQMRATAAEEIAKFGGNPQSRADIDRWLFWKEQGGICLYTGKTIPASELFHGAEWEVDHILPRWRSLDDSKMNKVLVHRTANHEKGNRTPAEWLGIDSKAFDDMLRRAAEMLKKGSLPYPKFKKLNTRQLDQESFAQRQLNDTRYITTLVADYLALLYPPKAREGQKVIQTCRGGLTAELRRQWGLNNILPPLYNADGKPVLSDRTDADGTPLKSRDDHRHHAIDAVVVALSSRSILKKYQDYWKKKSDSRTVQDPHFPTPWPTLRSDTKAIATRITVSHRVMRKIAGAFHEETFHGPARNRQGKIDPGRFVTRKPLASLTGKMVRNIRDDVIRIIITERLMAKGWDGKSNALPKDWFGEPLTMPSGMPIRKVRVEVPIGNPARVKHRFAVLGNNHHMEVVASRKKKNDGTPEKMWAVVVPTLEAARRVRQLGLDPVQRNHGPDKEFVVSLARKESVLATNPVTGERVVCVVQKLSGSSTPSNSFNFYLRDARDARPASSGNKTPFKIMVSFKAMKELQIEKVQVDPLGRIRPAND